eukprot:scaffold2935_cov104-Isochrysis_galbana.AAC.1
MAAPRTGVCAPTTYSTAPTCAPTTHPQPHLRGARVSCIDERRIPPCVDRVHLRPFLRHQPPRRLEPPEPRRPVQRGVPARAPGASAPSARYLSTRRSRVASPRGPWRGRRPAPRPAAAAPPSPSRNTPPTSAPSYLRRSARSNRPRPPAISRPARNSLRAQPAPLRTLQSERAPTRWPRAAVATRPPPRCRAGTPREAGRSHARRVRLSGLPPPEALRAAPDSSEERQM